MSSKTPVIVTESVIEVSTDKKYEIISKVDGLCAWVGKKSESGEILDCIPVFLEGADRGPLTYGMVLLADLARDATLQNRGGSHVVLGNVDTLDGDIKSNYGDLTLRYIYQEFLSSKLKPDMLRFVAKRYARNLKMNFPEVSANIDTDGHRIRLKQPPTLLANVVAVKRMTSLPELATWLGTHWVEAERNLVRKVPDLSTREKLLEELHNE